MTMQRALFVLGAALLCLGGGVAEAVSLDFVPAVQTVAQGNSAGVAVRISGLGDGTAPSLGAFDLDVAFNPSVLDFIGISFGDPVLGDQLDLSGLGSIISFSFAVGTGPANLSELSLALPDDLNALQAPAFTLATVTFAALAAGTSSLTFAVNALDDANGAPLVAVVGERIGDGRGRGARAGAGRPATARDCVGRDDRRRGQKPAAKVALGQDSVSCPALR
jgi:hypothetical protein